MFIYIYKHYPGETECAGQAFDFNPNLKQSSLPCYIPTL